MLAELIRSRKQQKGGIACPAGTLTWKEVLALAARLESEHAYLAGLEVAVLATSADIFVGILVALSELEVDILIAPENTSHWLASCSTVDFLVREGTDRRVYVERVRDGDYCRQGRRGGLTVFSSGTTGAPRPHRWSWALLLQRIRISEQVRGGLWLSGYPLTTFAGIQALLYGCIGADTLMLLQATDNLYETVSSPSSIQLAMGTPTFWRRALTVGAGSPPQIAVKTLSMGGEPATQDLLDRLRRDFGCHRIVHIYASSELGSLFSVSDGYAGFPAAWLDRSANCRVRLTIRDNELWVSRGPDCPFQATGDLVYVEGGRVYFAGRRSDQINVGGRKVNPLRVESALRSIKGIKDARVYGIRNRITGEVVAAEVVRDGYCDQPSIAKSIREYFRERKRTYETPLKLVFVDSIAMTHAGKLTRTQR